MSNRELLKRILLGDREALEELQTKDKQDISTIIKKGGGSFTVSHKNGKTEKLENISPEQEEELLSRAKIIVTIVRTKKQK